MVLISFLLVFLHVVLLFDFCYLPAAGQLDWLGEAARGACCSSDLQGNIDIRLFHHKTIKLQGKISVWVLSFSNYSLRIFIKENI